MGPHSHTYIFTNRAFIDPLILINGEGVKQGMRLVERLGALVCVRACMRIVKLRFATSFERTEGVDQHLT